MNNLIILNFIANAARLQNQIKAKNAITPSVGVTGQMFRRGADKSRLIHNSRRFERDPVVVAAAPPKFVYVLDSDCNVVEIINNGV